MKISTTMNDSYTINVFWVNREEYSEYEECKDVEVKENLLIFFHGELCKMVYINLNSVELFTTEAEDDD